MTAWRTNTGSPPDAIDRVRVRLRNGLEPAEPWMVRSRYGPTTRWSLSGDGFDIVEWFEA